MISFRYHIVSLVAVILALGVGIVVGTTALNGPVTHDLRNQVNGLKKDRDGLAAQNKTLQGQVDNSDQFAVTFGSKLVDGTLKSQSVLIVALPGTSTGMADGVANLLTAAGATITGRVALTGSYIDPSQGDSIRTLATGDAHPYTLSLPQTDDPRVLGAAMLAYVLTGHGQSTDLKTVLTGFSGLHMISSDPGTIAPSANVVVLGNGALDRNNYGSDAEVDLISQLVVAKGKVVVAGDAASAQGNGVVAAVRQGPMKSAVSSVDNAGTAFGQVSTALAMAQAITSQFGHYGTAKGADALFPSVAK